MGDELLPQLYSGIMIYNKLWHKDPRTLTNQYFNGMSLTGGFWSLLTCDATTCGGCFTGHKVPELRQEKMWKKGAAPRGALGSFDDEEMCEFLA